MVCALWSLFCFCFCFLRLICGKYLLARAFNVGDIIGDSWAFLRQPICQGQMWHSIALNRFVDNTSSDKIFPK